MTFSVGPTGPGTPISNLPGVSTPISLKTDSIAPSPLTLIPPNSGSLIPEGNISFEEFAKIVAQVAQKLRQALMHGEQQDFTISKNYYTSVVQEAESLLVLMKQYFDIVEKWKEQLADTMYNLQQAYDKMQVAIGKYNQAVQNAGQTESLLQGPAQNAIDTYNWLQGFNTDDFNNYVASRWGSQAAAQSALNAPIIAWNNYASTSSVLVAYIALTQEEYPWYNAYSETNAVINSINAERATFGIAPISNLPSFITVSDPHHDQFAVPVSLVPLPLGPGNPAIGNTQNTVADLANPLPSFSYFDLTIKPKNSDVVGIIFGAEIAAQLGDLTDEAAIYALFRETISQEQLASIKAGRARNIIFPAAYIDKLPQEFIDSTGGGAGLGVVGTNSHVVQRIFGNELFKLSALKNQTPVSPRFLETMQLVVLGLLNKTSLLASKTAISQFGNKIGSLSLESPAFAAILAASIADSIVGATTSNATREIVNKSLNNEVFAARLEGGPYGKLGELSAGEIAVLSGQITAGLNMAMLSIAIGLLGRNIGFPDLSLQMFANVSGLSPLDAQTAAAGGSRFEDVLHNPIALAFIKQSLLDTLVLNRGFTSEAGALIVNNALNGAISTLGGKFGDINVLQGVLQREFILQGLTPDNASLLATDALTMIRGEIGMPNLNQAMPENPTKEVTDEILNKISGDRKAVAAILKDSIERAIRGDGQYEVLRELRNDNYRELVNAGLKKQEAMALSNQLINLLAGDPIFQNPDTSKIKTALNIEDTKIAETLSKGPFSTQEEFLAVLRSDIKSDTDFDKALANLSITKIMDRRELHDALAGHLDAILKPALGEKQAKEVKESIVNSLIENPVSVLNQVNTQVAKLHADEDEAQMRATTRKLIELLQAILRPGAELGHIVQSIQDKPSTLIGSLASAAHPLPIETLGIA